MIFLFREFNANFVLKLSRSASVPSQSSSYLNCEASRCLH